MPVQWTTATQNGTTGTDYLFGSGFFSADHDRWWRFRNLWLGWVCCGV